MCGRYVIEWLPDEIHERFILREIPRSLFESFNAAPTQQLPVIVESSEGERELVMMRWGLIPRWARPGDPKAVAPINARAESVLEKPMFRGLLGKKRCLVPANGYFEWKREGERKQPYYFTTKDQDLFAFAGLYDDFVDAEGKPGKSYTIITTVPNSMAANYHLRMPVILEKDSEQMWLDPDITDGHALEHLLHSYPAEKMEAVPVSRAVNSVRYNSRKLIEPIGGADSGDDDSDDGPPSQEPLF